ncbi:MAG: LysR family transcriptional regulator [Pikeienuella sp.]
MKKIDLMALDGRQLALFIAIFDLGSVSDAAGRFDISQSSASHTLDKLRACFGDQLFVRAGRSIAPTEFAVTLAPRVREVVAGFEGLLSDSEYDPSQDTGAITIATNVTELLPELSEVRNQIRCEAPKIKLRFLELGSRENIEPFLIDQLADLIVTVRTPSYSTYLCKQELIKDDFVCFYDPNEREAPNTKESFCEAQHAALDFGGSRKSTVATALDEAALARSVNLYVSNVYAMGQLIADTDYIATMQRRLSSSAFKHLAFCEPPVPLPTLSFDLVWHRRSDASDRNLWLRAKVIKAFSKFK